MHNNHSILMVLITLHREFFRIDSEEVKKMMKAIILESECPGEIWYESLQSLDSGDFIFLLRGNYVSCPILRNGCDGIWGGCDINL
jgi:hypothetical protein